MKGILACIKLKGKQANHCLLLWAHIVRCIYGSIKDRITGLVSHLLSMDKKFSMSSSVAFSKAEVNDFDCHRDETGIVDGVGKVSVFISLELLFPTNSMSFIGE